MAGSGIKAKVLGGFLGSKELLKDENRYQDNTERLRGVALTD
jgi:hypothetical protein